MLGFRIRFLYSKCIKGGKEDFACMASICLFAPFRSICMPRPSFMHAFHTLVHVPSLLCTPPIYCAPSFLLHTPPLHSRARLLSTMRIPFLTCTPSFLPYANPLKSRHPLHTCVHLVLSFFAMCALPLSHACRIHCMYALPSPIYALSMAVCSFCLLMFTPPTFKFAPCWLLLA